MNMASLLSKKAIICFLIGLFTLPQFLIAQHDNFIWIKEFKPGSAAISDQTIDQDALQFVDSLMQRDDIEVTFLGAADPTKWRLFGKRVKAQIADAWDEAKKLERASVLRQRYQKGQIGTTDEPIRGVKVVWQPRRPDIFKMNERISANASKIDSLETLLANMQPKQDITHVETENPLPVIKSKPDFQYLTSTQSSIVSDWEVTTGFMVWSAGGPYDLSVPYLGIVFKRLDWAIELQGGFSPWSEYRSITNRGDAFLLGSFHLRPQSWCQIKTGFMSGWEFLTQNDVWTMKTMSLTAGPKFQYRFIETYIGYTYGKLSSLTEERWCSGVLITTNFHLKLN
jgi:hypothetical protein